MRVGLLGGTGPAGKGLAARLDLAGYDVVIGSRSAERAESVCAEIRAGWPDHNLTLKGGANEDASDCDIVIVATPWDAAASTVASCSKALEGKLVISMANALAKVGDEFQPLISPRGSVAGSVAARLPHSRVAAAFQHLPARELQNLKHPLDADVLVCSDHPSATEETIELISRIPDLRGIDGGPLSNAAPMEAMVAILLEVNVRYKTRASIKLTGIDR